MDKFSELKAAAMAATPGPWVLVDDGWSDGDHANITSDERIDISIIDIAQINGGGTASYFDEPFRTEQQANARYITAANPAVVLDLLAELEAKDKRIAELEQQPTIPEEIPEIDRGEGGSDIDYMAPQEIYDMGKTDGWNACRAAMLAAAPDGSINERIPPHIFSKMVGKLTDISREFSGTQQLRARIVRGLEEYLVPDHPHTRGKVVVTKDEQGDIVAVTRQDSEGKVLEIIAERGDA